MFTDDQFNIERSTFTGKYVITHESGFPVAGEYETKLQAKVALRAIIRRGQFDLDAQRPII